MQGKDVMMYWTSQDSPERYEKPQIVFLIVCMWYDIKNIAYPEKRAAILKFKYYLEEEAAQGRVIMDENNQPMQVKMVG